MDGSTIITLILVFVASLQAVLYTSPDRKRTTIVPYTGRPRNLILWSEKQEYLKSIHWKQLRRIVLMRDNNTCKQCGCTKSLNVHHITYKRLGDESIDDLVTVCRNCHQAIHDHHGYEYKGHFPLLKR